MLTITPSMVRVFLLCLIATSASILSSGDLAAQEAAASPPTTIAELNAALVESKSGDSEARHRLAIRRVIRDAETLLAAHQNDPMRFQVLEFLFRARQHLIVLDKDPKYRQDLLATCRELIKAPDDMAELRLEADLLLSQAELAKQGADATARARALIPFVDRYINSQVGAKVLRMAMVMALELGDSRTVTDLHEKIGEYFPSDLEMIAFQRDKLGGQVFGAPFSGSFERSDGKKIRFPMDGLGRATMLLFWSKSDESLALLKDLATASLANKSMLEDRLEFVSFNLDELPDAGESVIRGLGLDWQVLRLPGGKKNPIYDAFVREDPRMLSVSTTGQTALVMSGTSRQKKASDGTPDYGRMFGSGLARSWNAPRYVMQLRSLMAGDFLVVDPEGGIDPARPPELKSLAKGQSADALPRNAACVPEQTLRAIQDCFVLPPLRYRLSPKECRENYQKAEELCRKAIADHPQAPDLWVVRNRLIVALMGLWKAQSDLGQLEAAIAEAKAALAAGYPKGCDLVARFCIARESLRDPAANPRQTCDRLLADFGGDNDTPGPALAAAAMLALDVADRASFNHFRELILKDHTEYPMMWTFSAFLLDRHHDYWLFQVPFTAGWSFGRRERYMQTRGDVEMAHRMLKTELLAADGKPMRIPEDLDTEWTAIVFSQPAPWKAKREETLAASPARNLMALNALAATRPNKDLKVLLACFSGDIETIRTALNTTRTKVESPILTVPNGINNPLLRRLGMLSEDEEINTVLVRKDGRIVVMTSGLSSSNHDGKTISNIITRHDEMAVLGALERGDIETAKKIIFTHAPPYHPGAVDERGKKLPVPKYSHSHLRARASVYLALKDWDKALADAEEVVESQLGTDGSMSLRTDELDESEALRDRILELRKATQK